jgi:hypothetical protein
MNYEIIIKQEATQDLQVAYNYYEDHRLGLVDEFIEEVKEKIAYIRKYPLHFPKVEKEFRQTLIDRFPYLLIYELSGQ